MKKRLVRKLMSVIVTCTLLVCVVAGIPASAAVTYNYTAAVNYASEHWDDVDIKQCAEFVSDCLAEGGISSVHSKSTTTLWNNLGNAGVVASSALTYYSSGSYNYMYLGSNYGKVAIGDPIFYYCSNCRAYMHVILCAGADVNNNLIGYAHHDPQNADEKFPLNKTCYTCGGTYVYYARRLNTTGCSSGHSYGAYVTGASKHWQYCKKCGHYKEADHTWVQKGTGYQCTVCRKTSPYLPSALPDEEPVAG